MTIRKRPWRDYSGRVSGLKAAVFVALFLPGAWTVFAYATGQLGARPLNEAIHEFGLWMLRFLLLSLAVTPARRLLQWPRLILVRRMLGVAAFAYGSIHLSLYAADQAFNLAVIATEIVLRIYLTIGFVALCGLATLAATSTDGMVKRLGPRRWQRLHRLVYGIAVLGLIHYSMQSKLEQWEPIVMDGLFLWLMGWRAVFGLAPQTRPVPVWIVGGLSLAAAGLTALGEAAYFWIGMGAPPALVLAANFGWETGVRPAWVVLAATLALTLAGALRGVRRRQLRPA